MLWGLNYSNPAFHYFRRQAEPKNFINPVKNLEFQSTFQMTLSAARDGDAEMEKKLGDIYGRFNYSKEAYYWYRRAADDGQKESFGIVGYMLYTGEGTDKYLEEALGWFKMATEHGDPYGALMLGKDARFRTQNYHNAFQWFMVAARMGDPEAQYEVGNAYRKGRGIEADEEESAEWYRKAAEQGHTNATFQLGIYYKNRNDFEHALEWLKKSASKGDADSMTSIGNTYMLMSDQDEALKWYKKAAELGDARAVNMLKMLL